MNLGTMNNILSTIYYLYDNFPIEGASMSNANAGRNGITERRFFAIKRNSCIRQSQGFTRLCQIAVTKLRPRQKFCLWLSVKEP